MSANVIQPGTARTATNKTTTSTKESRLARPDSGRMTATQRNTFRMMLATGATLAALIGAQAMAVLDRTSASTPTTLTQSSATGASAAANYSNGSSAYSTSSNASNSSSTYNYRQTQTQPRPSTRSS